MPVMTHPAGPGVWLGLRLPFNTGNFGPKGGARKLQGRVHRLHQSRLDLEGLTGTRPADALTALKRGTEGLTGAWRKDTAKSDPMDEACDMVELPWIYRKAILVLNKLELEDTPEHFKTILKAGGIMDIVECYPWDGREVIHKRRDKRRGHHNGRVVRREDGPAIEVYWDNPHGGVCTDVFQLSEDGHTMTQVSNMTIRDTGRSIEYRTVYRRIQDHA